MEKPPKKEKVELQGGSYSNVHSDRRFSSTEYMEVSRFEKIN